MDERIGLKLRFPNPFPDEFGLISSRGIIGERAIHAIYQAWRIRELMSGIPNPRVIEIGGLGRTAFYSWQFGVKDYTIIDLPFTAVSQGYYLMRTLGPENVILHGESGLDPRSSCCNLRLFFENAAKVDLIVNVDSMTEVDRQTADRYRSHIRIDRLNSYQSTTRLIHSRLRKLPRQTKAVSRARSVILTYFVRDMLRSFLPSV